MKKESGNEGLFISTEDETEKSLTRQFFFLHLGACVTHGAI